jgi:hypothetical protein
MSLDVYLSIPGEVVVKPSRIFVREAGSTREMSREEWDVKFPGIEPVSVVESESDEVYSANITHNLNSMAEAAGIYKYLWRPDEIEITKASQLIEPLEAGLLLLKSDPMTFKKFNPPNGWGDYAGLVRFVENYLEACKQYPEATVRACR